MGYQSVKDHHKKNKWLQMAQQPPAASRDKRVLGKFKRYKSL